MSTDVVRVPIVMIPSPSEDDDLAAGAVLFHAPVRLDNVVKVEHLTAARRICDCSVAHLAGLFNTHLFHLG